MSHKQKHVGPTSSRVSPPLGALPSQPDSPEVQLPPPEPDLPPIQAVPMTDGTPAACMQKKRQGISGRKYTRRNGAVCPRAVHGAEAKQPPARTG